MAQFSAQQVEHFLGVLESNRESLWEVVPEVNGFDVGIDTRDGEEGPLAIRVFQGDEDTMLPEGGPESLKAQIQTIGAIEDVPLIVLPGHMAGQQAPAYPGAIRAVPLVGGVSVGPCRTIDGKVYTGTLGSVVISNNGGKLLGLSNRHVLDPDGLAVLGEDYCQPSRGDGGACPGDGVGDLHSLGPWTGQVDAACFEVDLALRPASASRILSLGLIAGTRTAYHGMYVQKFGRTTGHTKGFVSGIGATRKVKYGGPIGTITYTGQITIDPLPAYPSFSQGGDSGSIVLDMEMNAIGLHFAGDGFKATSNPIGLVEQMLGISVV